MPPIIRPRRPFTGSARTGEPCPRAPISVLRGELDTTMILAGVDDVKKIDHRAIASELPGEFAARN